MADPNPSNSAERGSGKPAPGSSAHDPTVRALTPPDTYTGGAPTLLGAQTTDSGSIGTSKLNPSIEPQNLLTDGLLFNAPRVKLDGVDRPVLGGIHLIAKLGQGGMGAVYYGINPRLETELAVKILPLTTAQNGKELVERFVREARIAARVRSPHIAAVYDVNSENGVFYIQMEYINGKSAGAYMRELVSNSGKGMDEATALDICIAAADGLAAAHAEGIIHRDIKPDNIMIPRRRARGSEMNLVGGIAPTGGPVVLDFTAAKLLDLGLARRLQACTDKDLTLQDTGMGTPGFMPPEQAQDAHSAREPADVYSLGATLYALLAGHAPFRGTTPLNVAMATIQKPHEPIENTRKDLNAKTLELLNTCLQKDPAKRPSTGTELLAAMRACRRAVGEVAPTMVKPKNASSSLPSPQAKPASAGAVPIPVPAPRPPSSKPKTASAPVQQPAEIAEMNRSTTPRPRKPEPTNRWGLVVLAVVFFMFVVGALAVIFVLLYFNSESSKNDPNDIIKNIPSEPYIDPNAVNPPNTWNNAADSKNAANLVKPTITAERIVPLVNGTITEIQAYPTLIVKIGDPLVTLRAENAVGRGKILTSPIEGEVEEILVAKGDYVTTQTALVTIKPVATSKFKERTSPFKEAPTLKLKK